MEKLTSINISQDIYLAKDKYMEARADQNFWGSIGNNLYALLLTIFTPLGVWFLSACIVKSWFWVPFYCFIGSSVLYFGCFSVFYRDKSAKCKAILGNQINQLAANIIEREKSLDLKIKAINALIDLILDRRNFRADEQAYYQSTLQEVQQLRADIRRFKEQQLSSTLKGLFEQTSLPALEPGQSTSLDVPQLEKEIAIHENRAMEEIRQRDEKLHLIGPRR